MMASNFGCFPVVLPYMLYHPCHNSNLMMFVKVVFKMIKLVLCWEDAVLPLSLYYLLYSENQQRSFDQYSYTCYKNR